MLAGTVAILALADAVIPGGRAALLNDLAPLLASRRFYSVEDVADRYRVSVSCVKQWQAKGVITPSIRIRGTVRFTLADLARLEKKEEKK